MAKHKTYKTYICKPCEEVYFASTRHEIPRPCPSCGTARWPRDSERTDDAHLAWCRAMYSAYPERFENPDPEQLALEEKPLE